MVEIPAALGQLGHEAEIHTIFHLISLPFGERKKSRLFLVGQVNSFMPCLFLMSPGFRLPRDSVDMSPLGEL